MAATNRTSFTITQPFLGSPLQFQPALGSKELEELIDAYVIGTQSKQEKMSVITVEFFHLATVDLNTGALTKTYEVFPFGPFSDAFFEQFLVESQSSGFSPPIFTPSPGSSATLGDSTYGSFSIPSITSPARTLGSARVTKKAAKKITKKPKVDEARLPGFSIMTKDGIDVTTTAGRGTKTKEQREHAHLMRIMKACDACKRKKIKCDPSHRTPQNDMSRASTNTPQSSTASAQLSPQYESRPGANAPALNRQSTQASQSVFTPSNIIDDFVLFPEDSASWNPEMSQAGLGDLNFNVNDIDFSAEYPFQNSDWSFYQQPFSGGFNVDQQLGQSFYQQQQPHPQVVGQQNYTNAPLMTESYETPGSYDMEQHMPGNHTGTWSQHVVAVADRTQTLHASQDVDSSEATVLAEAGSGSSRSTVLQMTEGAQESFMQSSVKASLPLVVVLAVLGSLFLCSKTPMISSLALLGTRSLSALRESSTVWIGNDSLTVVKLVLCAALTAHLPALTKLSLLCGGMALSHLLTGAEMSFEKNTASNFSSRDSSDIEDSCGDKRGLMAMMRAFSPVAMVQ